MGTASTMQVMAEKALGLMLPGTALVTPATCEDLKRGVPCRVQAVKLRDRLKIHHIVADEIL